MSRAVAEPSCANGAGIDLSFSIPRGYLHRWEVSMDERRNGEGKIRQVTREAFMRDASDALRYAKRATRFRP
jgi:hypothetical protein